MLLGPALLPLPEALFPNELGCSDLVAGCIQRGCWPHPTLSTIVGVKFTKQA